MCHVTNTYYHSNMSHDHCIIQNVLSFRSEDYGCLRQGEVECFIRTISHLSMQYAKKNLACDHDEFVLVINKICLCGTIG